jgi:hypothetical protein
LADGVSEAEFLRKLAESGIRKGSISELMNGPNDYDHALPLILDHVTLIKGPDDRHTRGYREMLIRSLAVPAAKKLPGLWPRLMKLFKAARDVEEKWVIANTVQLAARKEDLTEVVGILSDRTHEKAREPFCRVARRFPMAGMVPPLVAILHEKRQVLPEDDLDFPYGVQLTPADPIRALGWVAGEDIIKEIEPFLTDCYPGTSTPDQFVRSEAKKAIDRIRKRSGKTVEPPKSRAAPRKPTGNRPVKPDDWFRNDRWDDEEQAAFFKRLARCRSDYSRAQNARIKSAGLLRSGDPKRVRGGVNLLNRILAEWPFDSELACCYWQLAEGHARLGDLDQAIESFHRCFQQERKYSGVRTGAWADFVRSAVHRRLAHLYDEALDLHAGQALILAERGALPEARRLAEKALDEARKTHSGFAKHPNLGLVGDQNAWIARLVGLTGQL